MKKESLDEIKYLINYVNINESKFDQETLCTFRKSLNMIMFMEVNAPKIGKFDIFKFTAKDNLYSALTGVYYKDGMLIASDSYILVRTKIGYKEEYEGKIIAKDGNEVDGRYPNIDSVIPIVTEDYIEHDVDFDLIDAYVKSGKVWAETHLQKGKKMEDHLVLNFHGTNFRLMDLQKICTAMKAMGMNYLYINKDCSRPAFMTKDGESVLLMPLFPDEKYKGKGMYYYCEID